MLKIASLEAREERLQSLGRAIGEFYSHKRQDFCASTGLFFLDWIAEALEVNVIIWHEGGACMALSALSIAALAVLSSQASTFFIPGSLCAQDGGILEAFGHSGITFALLRRFQNPAWIGRGWRSL